MPDYASPAPILDLLRTTVLDALDAAGADPIGKSYVGLGEIAFDQAGMLVVGYTRIYRTTPSNARSERTGFPFENVHQDYHPDDWMLAFEVTVTLVRCVPLPQGKRTPTATALDEQNRKVIVDAATIWDTLAGPLPDASWERAALTQTTQGAEGGVIAVVTSFVLGVPGGELFT